MKYQIILSTLLFVVASCSSQSGTIRDRIKEKIKERMADKPAPTTTEIKSDKLTSPGDYIQSIQVGDLTRYFKVHIPKSYNGSKKVPLLFALHGGGGDMEVQSNDKYYLQISKSESEGYIVIFPNGYSEFKSGKFATWNAGNCCAQARDKNVDDIAFFKSLISFAKDKMMIDENKIFSTGMSNGGMMSYRLACELSDQIKGIGAVAGTDNTKECHPKNPVSILHIHAKDDDHVLFNGGLGPKALSKKGETEFNSVTNTINKWVDFNGCPKTSKRVLDINGAYCDLYSPCKNGTEVKLCVTETGGHSWPGGEKPRGGAPSKAIIANDIIWDFLKNK